MRNVLFIYRVLLPPLFCIGFGSARPSERSQTTLLTSYEKVEGSGFNSSLVPKDMLNTAAAHAVPDVTSFFDARVAEKHGTSRSREILSSNSLKPSLEQHSSHKIRFAQGAHIDKRAHRNKEPNLLLPKSGHQLTDSSIREQIRRRQNAPSQDLVSSGTGEPSILQDGRRSTVGRHRNRRSTSPGWSLSKLKLRHPGPTPPDYMVHLYNLLAGTHYELLTNTVVTSFVNIYIEETGSSLLPRDSHAIVFNVSLDKEDESIRYAELRLFVVRRNSSHDADLTVNNETVGIPCHINVSELEDPFSENSSNSRLVASKPVTVLNGAWESFNVSSVVQTWPSDGLKLFEVKILDAVAEGLGNSSSGSVVTARDVIDVDYSIGKDPLLVVFSKKTSWRDAVPHVVEKRDTGSASEPIESLLYSKAQMEHEPASNDETLNIRHYFQGLVNAVQTMAHQTNSDADSTRLFPADSKRRVSPTNETKTDVFDDGNYNFTFQNTDTAAKSLSREQFQRTRGNTPVLRGVGDSVRSVFESSEIETSRDSEMPDSVLIGRVRRQTKARYRRHLDALFTSDQVGRAYARFKRSKKKRNGCRRQELLVNFKQILWDNVIIIPHEYNAFECVGRCTYPMSDHLTPTKHAIVQTLLHTNYPQLANRACCVPTKLKPISVIYNDNGNIRFDYTYEGMVVAECGCR